MKIKYFGLYILACVAGYFAQVPGLGLLLIGIWMQIANLLWLQLTHASWVGKPESKPSQLFYLKYFIFTIPLIFIFGSVNGFFSVFWKEFDVFKILSLNLIQFVCSFLLCLFMVFNFSIYRNETNVSIVIVKIIGNLKSNLKLILNLSCLFWILNFLTLLISANEYFLVLNFALIHLYLLHWIKTKPVVVYQG